eukprot:TRINITY_DN111146_c0_g1_i1.p1 TRINITY_DN111146_c0_g1~~TRINITY_DN111146_c0_g1_i1.p1  ORF type:complete len:350 (+),score=59.44 TRINITY_DN111146_c0_g1_i1:73-1050(+)
MAGDGDHVAALRNMMIGNNPRAVPVSDFSSDVGRKKFGFSHEDIDDGSAFYEGQFKMYMRTGQGTLQNHETGAKYVGQFQADKFHGHGDQTWPDGSRYIGEWQNGRKHGSGVYISAENLKYEGGWQEGRRHGKGSQEYANGDKYDGYFFDGQCSGLGTYIFVDGSQYQGAWSHGRYDGGGMMYHANGDRERLFYTHGLLTKREVLPPGPVPKMQNRAKPTVYGKILECQDREEVMKPTLLGESHPSPFLIKRETDTWNLSAPPIRTPKPKTSIVDHVQKQIGDLLTEPSLEFTGGKSMQESTMLISGGPSLDEGGTFFTTSIDEF